MKIKRSRKSMNFMPYILLAIVVVSSYLILANTQGQVHELNYNELTTQITSNNVEEIKVTPRSASGVYIVTGRLISYEKGTSIPNDNYIVILNLLIQNPDIIKIILNSNKMFIYRIYNIETQESYIGQTNKTIDYQLKRK